MQGISRRDFLKYGTALAGLFGLQAAGGAKLAEALEQLAQGAAPVLWLQGQSCSGCSVSFLNTEQPAVAEVLTRYISLAAHSTLSAATGEQFMEIINKAVAGGGYYLVAEGSVPAGMPKACMICHAPYADLLLRAASGSRAVIAIGTCAAAGGIPAAEDNPTGAISVPAYFKKAGVSKPTILLPGCPCHPDWLVGTLAHLLKIGVPPLDELGRPLAFYGRPLHDICPRFADYERERYARFFGDQGCLFQLGCLGPITRADCTQREWNGVNTCIKAGAPCIGCASPEFALRKNLPFYRKNPAFRISEEKK